MEINIKDEYMDLTFDTDKAEMLSIPSKEKYHQVDIAIKPEKDSCNIVIATLDFSSMENFENLQHLGAEIARRWNEFNKLTNAYKHVEETLEYIAYDCSRLTSGNVSHNARCLQGAAQRRLEYIRKHKQ